MGKLRAIIDDSLRVFIGMWECGKVKKTSAGYWKFIPIRDVFRAVELRMIAAKLDELNDKGNPK